MKTYQLNVLGVIMILFVFMGCGNNKTSSPLTLKDAFQNQFYIGAALNVAQIHEVDEVGIQTAIQQFNSIVAENCMKSMYLQPTENTFFFDDADKFVTLGELNNMHIIGHTLVWHSQAPTWFFIDENGQDVSRDVLIERVKTYIYTVVGRYKGRIHGWDVVNETFEDDGSWRATKFYDIIGEDYIALAFQFAHEADPSAELYYNDYGTSAPLKREAVVRLVKSLQEQEIRIDGVGMQGHIGLDYPSLNEFEESILAFSATGVKVMVTEMDVTVLPFPLEKVTAEISLNYDYQHAMNPYREALPDSIRAQFEKQYTDFFSLFLKHQDKISRVTLWGVSDDNSWRNDWPIKGRVDYPLLFDRNYQAKPIVDLLLHLQD